MPDPFITPVVRVLACGLRHAARLLRRHRERLHMDRRTAYLAQASDCADCEARLRRWDAAEREAQLPFV
jgi:hypothetical protein